MNRALLFASPQIRRDQRQLGRDAASWQSRLLDVLGQALTCCSFSIISASASAGVLQLADEMKLMKLAFSLF
jgi:hypothetical protein